MRMLIEFTTDGDVGEGELHRLTEMMIDRVQKERGFAILVPGLPSKTGAFVRVYAVDDEIDVEKVLRDAAAEAETVVHGRVIEQSLEKTKEGGRQ